MKHNYNPGDFLTVQIVAKMLGIHRSTVYRKIRLEQDFPAPILAQKLDKNEGRIAGWFFWQFDEYLRRHSNEK